MVWRRLIAWALEAGRLSRSDGDGRRVWAWSGPAPTGTTRRRHDLHSAPSSTRPKRKRPTEIDFESRDKGRRVGSPPGRIAFPEPENAVPNRPGLNPVAPLFRQGSAVGVGLVSAHVLGGVDLALGPRVSRVEHENDPLPVDIDLDEPGIAVLDAERLGS